VPSVRFFDAATQFIYFAIKRLHAHFVLLLHTIEQ
jgi:hypothetical protein